MRRETKAILETTVEMDDLGLKDNEELKGTKVTWNFGYNFKQKLSLIDFIYNEKHFPRTHMLGMIVVYDYQS